ncbi:hypothetical protein Cni_G21857 [Canna indica]|uniref:Cytochrome P450 n=1 Tax=Canna indica TaxID=4628 RepID=A0AAQ3KTY7_9LILI|nr:hypothetical protein Cni_G21857 [Canna indica]
MVISGANRGSSRALSSPPELFGPSAVMCSERVQQSLQRRYQMLQTEGFNCKHPHLITWFFYMLCKHPLIQEKVAAEVKVATKSEGSKNDIAGFALSLSDEVIGKMQYLHAAITETLRLYPAVPVEGKRAVEDDVLPDGFEVKMGDRVNYISYAMGRMNYLWGEDAEVFHPERWLEDGVFKPESPFKFVSFNAGPRICFGKEFAYKQMKIMAATILHFFKFKLEDESKTDKYRTMFTLQIQDGLPLLAFHRSN